MTENRFEPKILAFCCKYCAYAAGDLAGSMRLNYPPNVKIIQIPCSGRVDMRHLLRAVEDGADGVYVAGCLEGECHFIEGNLKTKRKVAAVQKLLTEIDIEPERVRMFNLSSAMGPRFAEIATEMTEAVRRLGPSPIRSNDACIAAESTKFAAVAREVSEAVEALGPARRMIKQPLAQAVRV